MLLKAHLRSETVFGNWKPFKIYFTLKAPFVVKIFKFLFWPFGCVENGSIRKITIISKFLSHKLVNKQLQYTYWPIHQEIKVTNYVTKFGQFIEHNMEKRFSGKIIPKICWRNYSKISKLRSLDQHCAKNEVSY